MNNYILLSILNAIFNRERSCLILFFISIIISAIAALSVYNGTREGISTIHELISYDLRLYNYMFFVFGMLLKEKWQTIREFTLKHINIVVFDIIILSLVYSELFSYSYHWIEVIMAFLLSYSICLLIFVFMIEDRCPRNVYIENMGIQSYCIYLWHVFPIKMINLFCENHAIRVMLHFGILVFALELLCLHVSKEKQSTIGETVGIIYRVVKR